MTTFNPIRVAAVFALTAAALPAFSHIVLESKTAPAGSSYKAVFMVGHGCQGSPTTGVAVQLPSGFQGAKPYPKAGWTLSVQKGKLAKPYSDHGRQVTEDVTAITWTAASKEAALQEAHFDEFVLRGKLPEAAGPLWFKVLQSCETGSTDWSEIPASGTSTQGMKSPAALLEVMAPGQVVPATAQAAKNQPGQPAVQVAGAWVRATVPGQKGSGAFMKITSQAATRLIAISTPVAGVAEVHEMKMEGDVMKMRAVAGGLEIPAGKTVELKASAYHVMLMDLKQTLVAGSTVPLTLRFKNARGVESSVNVIAPVGAAAPAAAPGATGAPAPASREEHRH